MSANPLNIFIKGPESFVRLGNIRALAERLAGAAGKSTNIELVNHLTKLGGNGPIMANALASFGLPILMLIKYFMYYDNKC